MSVPDWDVSTMGLRRVDELKRRGTPLPQEVCPSRDSPLNILHRFGWSLLDQKIWPAAALNNPIIYYLVRRRFSFFLEDLLGVLPWLLLLAGEGVVFYWCVSAKTVAPVAYLLFAELLFLPLLAGIWAQTMVQLHFRRLRGRVPWEELALTRLDPLETMTGLSLRPMLVQAACSILASLPTLPMLAAFYWFFYIRSSVFRTGPCEALFYFLLILYRAYILKASVEFASILALRCCLFIRSPLRCYLRGIRDWIYPWGLIPVLLVASVAGAILIQTVTAVFFYAAILIPLVVLWLMFTIPGLLRTYAQETMFWVGHHKRDWVLRSAGQSQLAPKSFFSKWKLERGMRQKG